MHCDVHIFEWLMAYVKVRMCVMWRGHTHTHTHTHTCTQRKHGLGAEGAAPDTTLTVKNIVSILISSDFLLMDELVEQGLE